MQQQQDVHIFTGMEKDVSASKQEANIMYDAHNIRITARTKETALSITNELGPQEIIITEDDFKYYPYYRDSQLSTPIIQKERSTGEGLKIEGTYLASCTLNDYLILMTYVDENNQCIYRITLGDTIEACRLFKGILGHTAKSKIDIVVSFENTNVQKIYWGDEGAAPKVMNISPYSDYKISGYTSNSFNFYPDLNLGEEVTVTRHAIGGQFSAGVIQWAFTYYNRFLQETNIFYVTPIYYIAPADRGGSPEAVCSSSFTLTINNLDTQFEYLRIYSILRTSLNTTPLCKRVADIKLTTNNLDTTDAQQHLSSVSYIDTGTNGDTIDPTSLLYKGGQAITAGTLTMKDNTLFLGNVSLQEPQIYTDIKKLFQLKEENSGFPLMQQEESGFYTAKWTRKGISSTCISDYFNPLSLKNNGSFKANEIYRFGIQFQYKTGTWTDPIWIGDSQVNVYPSESYNTNTRTYTCSKPILNYTFLKTATINTLIQAGYKKARGVIAEPSYLNRLVQEQGVLNPTMYTKAQRGEKNSNGEYSGTLAAQASWLFRPYYASGEAFPTDSSTTLGRITPHIGYEKKLVSCFDGTTSSHLHFPSIGSPFHHTLRMTEFGAYLSDDNSFYISNDSFTFHSPDLLWDESLWSGNTTDLSCYAVGYVACTANYSDAEVLTSSAPLSSEAKGFIGKPMKGAGDTAWLGQLCYSDCICDDAGDSGVVALYIDTYPHPVMWAVYLWQPNGSLNNDVNREGQTATLQTKKISNYKEGTTTYSDYGPVDFTGSDCNIAVVTSDELALSKAGPNFYMGNIDTLLTTEGSPIFFGSTTTGGFLDDNEDVHWGNVGFANSNLWLHDTLSTTPNFLIRRSSETLLKQWPAWVSNSGGVDHAVAYLYYKDGLAHMYTDAGNLDEIGDYRYGLSEKHSQIRMRYKTTPHCYIAFKNSPTFNQFLMEGYPVLPLGELRKPYNSSTFYGGTSQNALQSLNWIPASEPVSLKQDTKLEIKFEYGDTYFGRFDCLKTYAWSSEDPNQVIDILRFSVESHINGAGRYDRNRGQHANLNMSPVNYNLMNTVYSQLDNFFSYQIQPDANYEMNAFPTEIVWSTEKSSGADVDAWTSITHASTYTMDGSKGPIIKLLTWNDNIYCFQEKAISQVIFNPRVQINTSDNLPIEISNNYKLEGSRSLADGVGVTNQSSIRPTPTGIYFIDNTTQNLYHMGQAFNDISSKTNMTIYFNSIPIEQWVPNKYTSKIFYEATYQDVYVATKDTALCLNTQLGTFTSYMDYGEVQDIFNIVERAYCIRNKETEEQDKVCALYELWKGAPNYFFGEYKPFSLTYISNGKNAKQDASVLTKTFTNITFRGDRWDGDTLRMNGEKLERALPVFDYVRVYDEYQDTQVQPLKFVSRTPSNLKEKFRSWHIDIPRHKKKMTTSLGVQYQKTRDRIRNPWCKIELGIIQDANNPNTDFIELHDIFTTYFI